VGFDTTGGSSISTVFRDTLKPLVDAAMSAEVTDLPTKVPGRRLECLQKLLEKKSTNASVLSGEIHRRC